MEPLNGYIQVKPLKQGMISSVEGNEYEVVEIQPQMYKDIQVFQPPTKIGDIIIIEDSLVVRVNVNGEETYFVREENILARIPGKHNNPSEG